MCRHHHAHNATDCMDCRIDLTQAIEFARITGKSASTATAWSAAAGIRLYDAPVLDYFSTRRHPKLATAVSRPAMAESSRSRVEPATYRGPKIEWSLRHRSPNRKARREKHATRRFKVQPAL